ncbi:MAG: LTA synthase family protein [Deltaproteobacteria bacterium]|nr:LTA synthase family protein [Deltaproteobacteria bacterium]
MTSVTSRFHSFNRLSGFFAASFWPIYVFVVIAGSRAYKFRLDLVQIPLFVLQDCILALVLSVPFFAFLRTVRKPLYCALIGFFIFTPAVWLSLIGMTVTGIIGLPVDAKLLTMIPDLVFIQVALNEDSVANSLSKMSIVTVGAPIIGFICSYFLFRFTHRFDMPRISRWFIGFVAISMIALPFIHIDERGRDTNGIATVALTALGLAARADPAPPNVAHQEFNQRISTTSGDSYVPNRGLARLLFDGTKYSVLVIIIETGVASVINLEKNGDIANWLPNIHAMTGSSIFLARHLCPTPNSSRSIFSIVTGRYPYPDFRNPVIIHAHNRFPSIAQILRKEGYKIGAFTSFPGDYERMNTFLKSQDFDILGDVSTLGLPLVPEWSFGLDEILYERYIEWREAHSDAASFFILMPSNSHSPFYAPASDKRFRENTRLNRYKNALIYQDRILGKLRRRLDQQGLLDRTILVLIPDHGSYFDLVGQKETDESTVSQYHVPVLIDHPRLRTLDLPITIYRATSHIDIAPTLMDMTTRTSHPYDLQGISLLRIHPGRRLVFFSQDFHDQFVGASDGRKLVLWNRHLDNFSIFEWYAPSLARPWSSSSSGSTDKSIFLRIRDFYAYQISYLNRFEDD